MKVGAIIVICSILGCYALPAQAASSDPRVRGARLCTAYIPTHERQYGIPSHLLSAIASHESGRYHKGLEIMLPWPWTINVEGKGYYFDSKREAIAAVKKHMAAGRKSIDIGCMQVNMVHHPDAFPSLEKGFDPKYNIQYAASFLRRLYEDEKSWRKAAAAYHSKTPSRGQKYVSHVFKAWETIIQRLKLPNRTTSKADAGFDGKDLIRNNTQTAGVKTTRPAKRAQPVTLTRKTDKPKPPAHEPVKMKVIKVSDANATPAKDAVKDATKKTGIIMIKPDVTKASVAKAYKAPNTKVTRVDQQPTKQRDLNIIRFDQSNNEEKVTVASAHEQAKPRKISSGPRFIFTE